MNNSPHEPWLSPPSLRLISDVSGFVKFLGSHSSKNRLKSRDSDEIDTKIDQLSRWTNFATQVMESPMDNYVDELALQPEAFKIFQTRLSGKFVKVIFSYNDEIINAAKWTSPPEDRFDRFEPDEEGKSCEGIFRGSSERNGCIEIESLMLGEKCLLRNGYVFEKSLRRVSTPTETRDVFTAILCHFNEVSGKIIRIFPSERFIIKRVGKTTSEFSNVRLRREFKVQHLFSQLNHENINELVHFFEDEANMISISKSAGDIDLLDYLQGFVKDYKKGLPESAVRKIFKGPAEALLIAHNVGVAHRDISLENLVLNNFNPSNKKIEVIDWGHSISVAPGSNLANYEGPIGKGRYMAPELFREFFPAQNKYDPFKADSFAFGVCLFCVLVGQMPFANLDDSRGNRLRVSASCLIEHIENKLGKKLDISDTAIDLLNKSLEWDPEKRCSLEQILKHPFFAEE